MKTERTKPVSCFCCRKAIAVKIIKDCGFRTYPACAFCIRIMESSAVTRPQIIRPC